MDGYKQLFAYSVGVTDICGREYTDTIYAETEADAIKIAKYNPLNADVWMIGRTSGNKKL